MSIDIKQSAAKLVELAKKAGACDVDALAVNDIGESITVRGGSIEKVEREDSQGIGLRVFVESADGLAFASASSSDLSADGMERLVSQAIAMARISAADPDAMPPSGADHPSGDELTAWAARHAIEKSWTLDAAIDAARACEAAALESSDKIENSEGADAGFGATHVAYASGDGFAGEYSRSSLGLSLSVIAGRGEAMQRDYAYSRARHPDELRDPEEVGREAAERAVRRLGAKSIATRRTTVIFEPRMATSILGHLAGAINGRSVLQNRSFLADSNGELIFPEFINIADDPDHPDGLGNRLFDGEGTRCSRRSIIDNGRLTGFLTDRYAAARLKTAATGNAQRGLTGDTSIGTANLILSPGEKDVEALLREIGSSASTSFSPGLRIRLAVPMEDVEALLREIGSGLLVTEMMGMGVNGVTGDYSRGAAGFLIENGEITQPVNEVTIAGNLKEMFMNISHLGSDLTWFGSRAVPTIAIGGMTVAGQE